MVSSQRAGENMAEPRNQANAGAPPRFSRERIFRVIVAYRRLVIACAILGLLGGILAAILPRHYSATCVIRIMPGEADQFKISAESLLSDNETDEEIESESVILTSDSLYLQVAKELNLVKEPLLWGVMDKWFFPPRDLNDPDTATRLLKKLDKDITVTVVPRTQIIDIECRTKSAVLSDQICNTLVNDYMTNMFQTSYGSMQRVATWLSGQLGDIKNETDDDEKKLIALQDKLGIVGLKPSVDIIAEGLGTLERAKSDAEVERIVSEARYRALSSGSPNLVEGGQTILSPEEMPSASQASLLSSLRLKRAAAEADFDALRTKFGAAYPDVKRAKAELDVLNKEVDDEQGRVLNQAKEAYTASLANENMTQKTLADKKDEAFKQGDDMARFAILEEQYEASRSMYEAIIVKLREAGIVAGLLSAQVNTIDLARIVGKPDELPIPVEILLGLLAGLILGPASALTVHQFDTRLEDLSALEWELNLPALAIVPVVKEKLSGRSVISDPRTHFSEAIQILRTSLMLSRAGTPPKVMLFTSTRAGEGKSTIASSLASVLAASNSRVLLIDADLRRPTIHVRFDLPNRVGLANVLTGDTGIDNAIQPVSDFPRLFVLTSGPKPPRPAELLESPTMKALVEECSKQFDFVCVDSPPALGLADATILAPLSDAVVLIARFDTLNTHLIRQVENNLDRIGGGVTGIVVNFTENLANEYYGYSEGYYDLPDSPSPVK